MHITPLILIALFSLQFLSGCNQTKGESVSRCLDNYSIEECDKKHNP